MSQLFSLSCCSTGEASIVSRRISQSRMSAPMQPAQTMLCSQTGTLVKGIASADQLHHQSSSSISSGSLLLAGLLVVCYRCSVCRACRVNVCCRFDGASPNATALVCYCIALMCKTCANLGVWSHALHVELIHAVQVCGNRHSAATGLRVLMQ